MARNIVKTKNRKNLNDRTWAEIRKADSARYGRAAINLVGYPLQAIEGWARKAPEHRQPHQQVIEFRVANVTYTLDVDVAVSMLPMLIATFSEMLRETDNRSPKREDAS